MERNTFSNSLKDHTLDGTKTLREKDHRSPKDHSWISNSSHGFGDQDYLGRFLWPPRSYTCSFCRREFRSAQALGGHMNVHRRDRARLRQSPSKDGKYPFLKLNLNPKLNFPSLSLVSYPSSCTLPSLVSPSSSSTSPFVVASPSEMKISSWGLERTLINALSLKASDLSNKKGGKSFLEIIELDAFIEEDDGCKLLKKAENVVRLDLEIGLLNDSKEDLDLDLRLGYY